MSFDWGLRSIRSPARPQWERSKGSDRKPIRGATRILAQHTVPKRVAPQLKEWSSIALWWNTRVFAQECAKDPSWYACDAPGCVALALNPAPGSDVASQLAARSCRDFALRWRPGTM